ncbi:four helix bundle protein [Gracilimonas sp. Q87]|uniref:four helix bundle protein n=1 Tax=Gracilimonas sp. Q87 TaxID=3384766 RepID=UPI0039845391
MIHSFTDMEVWQKANELAIEVFKLTISLPHSEDYALTSQVRRSSNSVSGNIAEGFGRRTNKDKGYFYTIARGSAFETQSHLKYGNGVGYFNEEATNRLFTEYKELIHQLNKIMKSLG